MISIYKLTKKLIDKMFFIDVVFWSKNISIS